MTATTSADVTTNLGVHATGPRCLREAGYLLVGLPLAVAAFLVSVAGLATGMGTLVVWLGFPILALSLRACRALAALERRATAAATGRELPPCLYRVALGPGRTTRLLPQLRDPQSWRDLLHAVLGFPLRLAAAVITLSWGLGGLGALLSVTWFWAVPHGNSYRGLADLVAGSRSPALDVAITTALGALLLLTFPLVTRGLVVVRAAMARGLLTNQTAALRARTSELTAARRAAVDAEARTLRRVERDLHDGPQQRLVRLDMDLEGIGRRLDDDPGRARTLLAEALVQNREALAELRALSRGIAPPILADRGLAEAITAAAGRCPVPVTLDIDLPDGAPLSAAVENTAYFVVTEALTNVAKHAAATRASVMVGVDGDRVTVQVADDGRGGAHPGKGHGLSGLADRLTSIEGHLDVTSPVSGPTVLTADIPLAGVGPSRDRMVR
ncbi:sensor histidine kinase [Actinomycetospora sp. NBRC 106378]|uniref:sensor histidine kinase n=1 Tax=Actinomycetospora sp. NBRC 106378 TaxID=3032208 RepID=UPI0024A32AD7|nr:sensor histidine kinase [Actinomycetospora sp. NBRC 106378]GLZ52625.1 histidine kinase [Actinomycetospora sp. NBRC 106378]